MNDIDDVPEDKGTEDSSDGAKDKDNPEVDEGAGELGGGSKTGALGGGQPTEPTEPTEPPSQ